LPTLRNIAIGIAWPPDYRSSAYREKRGTGGHRIEFSHGDELVAGFSIAIDVS
jgi:hypothetical protein